MPYFNFKESFIYYDGHQLFLIEGQKTVSTNKYKPTPIYIVTQTCDEGVYFGSRITKRTLIEMKFGRIDVRDAMMNAYNDEYFVYIDSYMLPQINKTNTIFQTMFGFRVDGFHESYDKWAIPDPGLYLNDFE